MSFFNARVIGTEEIYKDFREELKSINAQIPKALERVGSEMIYNLQEHIQKDFYDAFTPEAYERRSNNPWHGTPMIDESNMSVFVKGKQLDFSYLPDTVHEYYDAWIEDRPNRGFHPLARPSDDLIKWAQHEHKLKNGVIPARPFWNNFVEDQIHNRIISNFGAGMNPKYKVIAEGNGLDVESDGLELLPSDEIEELPF
jgi:hypothetical protein